MFVLKFSINRCFYLKFLFFILVLIGGDLNCVFAVTSWKFFSRKVVDFDPNMGELGDADDIDEKEESVQRQSGSEERKQERSIDEIAENQQLRAVNVGAVMQQVKALKDDDIQSLVKFLGVNRIFNIMALVLSESIIKDFPEEHVVLEPIANQLLEAVINQFGERPSNVGILRNFMSYLVWLPGVVTMKVGEFLCWLASIIAVNSQEVTAMNIEEFVEKSLKTMSEQDSESKKREILNGVIPFNQIQRLNNIVELMFLFKAFFDYQANNFVEVPYEADDQGKKSTEPDGPRPRRRANQSDRHAETVNIAPGLNIPMRAYTEDPGQREVEIRFSDVPDAAVKAGSGWCSIM